MIRKLGYFFLITGFIAVVIMCYLVTPKTYGMYISQRNNLSQQQVTADVASNAIRDVTLKMNGIARQIILPATVMLIGGLMIGIQQKKKGNPTTP